MERTRELIRELQNCEKACLYCAKECLNEDDVSTLSACIALDWNCADFCGFTARLLIREDKRSAKIIELCQEICAECASECEKHEHDHCKKCAEACRKCEQQCSEYLK